MFRITTEMADKFAMAVFESAKAYINNHLEELETAANNNERNENNELRQDTPGVEK